jgi:cytoskeleton protein RodZ
MIDRDMSFKELGELLRMERERQGVGMDQVIKATMLNRRKLTAIEEGRLDEMPHAVYAKGFIKNYAQLLGLDTEAISEIVDRAYGVKPTAEAPAPIQERIMAFSAPPPERDRSRDRRSVLPTVLVLLALVVMLAGLVMFIQSPGQLKDTFLGGVVKTVLDKTGITRPQDKPTPALPAAPAAKPAPAPAPVQEPAPQPGAQSALQPAAQPVAEIPAAQPHPVQNQSVSSQKAAEALAGTFKKEPVKEPVKEPLKEVATLAKETFVSVTASPKGTCWGQVQIDGGETKKFYVQYGQAARFDYTKTLWLRLGNAAAVQVLHNGQPVPIEAAQGQVKVLTFP